MLEVERHFLSAIYYAVWVRQEENVRIRDKLDTL